MKRRVYFQGEEVKVRPKSFELLKLFIENPNEVISKTQMLSTIWDDVGVDEQVIFQSIKELRKAFANIDAIKTFPRKGYAWVGDVEIIEELASDNLTITAQPSVPKSNIKQAYLTKHLTKTLLVSLLFIIVYFSFLYGNDSSKGVKNSEMIHGSILVLPIKEHINDRDHKWVAIGAMDQLIQQIPPSKDYGVMQVDDVLDIMKRAQMPLKDFDAEDINKIFVVSGAALIIEAELTGTTGDYQLVYTLRRRQSIDRGVLLTVEAYDAIDQLAQIIASNIGAPTPIAKGYHSNLSNQLLAQALDKKISGDFLGTEQYLKSLLELEPENIKAKRLLAEVSVYNKKTEQIVAIVSSVEYLLGTQNQLIESDEFLREYARLQFWQGVNELQFGHVEQAQAIFERAKEQASKVHDWLYLGYLAEVQGHVYRSKKQYELAKQQYHIAINNHRIIKCPFGEVNNLLHIAEADFLQEEYGLAQKNANKAFSIAQKRELVEAKEKIAATIEKYSSFSH